MLALAQLSVKRDVVATPKSAFVLLPPQFVSGPNVIEAFWSSDGAHLAVFRRTLDVSTVELADLLSQKAIEQSDAEDQIVVWSAKSQKTSTVFRLKESLGSIDEVAWVVGSSQMVVRATMKATVESKVGHQSIFLLSSSGSITRVATLPETANISVEPNPYKAQVALTEFSNSSFGPANAVPVDTQPPVLRVFGIDGHLSQACKFPSAVSSFFWGADGFPYVLSREQDSRSKVQKSVWYALNPISAKLSVSPAPPGSAANPRKEVELELQVQSFSATYDKAKDKFEAPTVLVLPRMPNAPQIAVATTDGKDGQLSPTLNGVSYSSQGSLMVRPIGKISLEAYRMAKLNEERAKLMDIAKQFVVGLVMNAEDNDGNLLSNKGDWRSQLDPYLKDIKIGGFEYTFGGGLMSKISDPANTSIGFVTGPGGRAVAYADGHVQWVPNP